VSDHYKGFMVAMRDDLPEEEMEAIRACLERIKGVTSVVPFKRDVVHDQIIKARTDIEWRGRILNLLKKENT
jgi:hypothetical protein